MRQGFPGTFLDVPLRLLGGSPRSWYRRDCTSFRTLHCFFLGVGLLFVELLRCQPLRYRFRRTFRFCLGSRVYTWLFGRCLFLPVPLTMLVQLLSMLACFHCSSSCSWCPFVSVGSSVPCSFSTTKIRKSIDIYKYFMLICINIVLKYVNTYFSIDIPRFLLVRWLVAYAPALYPHYFCWAYFWWPPYGRPCLRVHSWTQIPTKTTKKHTKISITNVIYCKTEKCQNLLHTFPNLTFRTCCTLSEI